MKKQLGILFLSVILCFAFRMTVCAENVPTAAISEQTAEIGNQVTLEVTLSDCRTLKSMMIKDIIYDDNALELVSGTWSVSEMAIKSDYQYGVASMALAANRDINGKVFELVFNVKNGAKPGDIPVSLTLFANYAVQGSADVREPITVISGKVSVVCKHGNTEIRGIKDATCTETGYSGDTYCNICGEMISSGIYTDALGHTGGVANCHTKAVCTRCSQEYGEYDYENHIGGTELKNIIAATETEEGYTGDTVCLGCGTVIKKGEKIPKLEHTHSFGEWIVIHEATIDNEGLEKSECSCGKYEERSIPKLLSSIVSSEGKLTVSSDSGFQADTELIVNDVSGDLDGVLSESAAEKVTANIAILGKNAEILSAFDIYLSLDGKKIQPNGTVKVKIPIPENADSYDQLTVVYIGEDGSVIKLATTVTDDKMLEFETDHFSIYAVLGASLNNGIKPLYFIIPIVVALIVAGVVIIRKKKIQ